MKYRLSLLALTFVGAFAAETNSRCSNQFIIKAGYSKLSNDNIRKNHMIDDALYALEVQNMNKNFNGHSVLGIGYSYKYHLKDNLFVGFNAGYENSNNQLRCSVTGRSGILRNVDFKLKHSINFMPTVGFSIKNVDIYAMVGVEHVQIDYSQKLDITIPASYEVFKNDYKVHNWKCNYAWCAGLDILLNEKASLGLEYKGNKIKVSFTEYPNLTRDKTNLKIYHHTVSIAFKYKF